MAETINVAAEGDLDEAVAEKLIAHVGGVVGNVPRKKGKSYILKQIDNYNYAARYAPWLVLVDLDREADCAPHFRGKWLPNPAPRLCFRIVIRAVEAWLMADAQTLSRHLGVAQNRIPKIPEGLQHPKVDMVNLGRHSRRRGVRESMVPRENSGRPVGPAYTSLLMEYVREKWRPEIAAKQSESLRRAIRCLKRLV